MNSARRILSVSHLTALDAAPEDFLGFAAEGGFNAVGLRINPPAHTADRWPVAGDLARAKRLKSRADHLGITVFEIETFSVRPDFSLDAVLPGIEAGAEMGARMLVAAGLDPEENRQLDNYRRLAEAAAQFGLTVGIEFMPFQPLASLADAMRVEAALGLPNARILVDTLHLSRCGASPADVLALGVGRLAYVHLSDAPLPPPPPSEFAAEARGSRLYPGSGGLPLVELLAGLPVDMPVSVEAPDPRHMHKPLDEQVRLAGMATRAVLRRVDEINAAATAD